jgi:hypothetical protein
MIVVRAMISNRVCNVEDENKSNCTEKGSANQLRGACTGELWVIRPSRRQCTADMLLAIEGPAGFLDDESTIDRRTACKLMADTVLWMYTTPRRTCCLGSRSPFIGGFENSHSQCT